MSDIVERLRATGASPDTQREAADEIERLRAIVDRLPKTADGVPVVPGMMVWTLDKKGETRYRGVNFIDTAHRLGQIDGRNWSRIDWAKISSECYSTRKAAEQAAKEQR